MTVLLPSARTLSKHTLPRSCQLLTRLATSNPLLRVSLTNDTVAREQKPLSRCLGQSNVLRNARAYATAAAAKPAGRPKAHTGRTPAKRKAGTTAKKTTAKKIPGEKAPRPKKKAVKAKPKPKPKPKPKSKTKTKVVSEAVKKRQEGKERAALKKVALLHGAPKLLPGSAYQILFNQKAKESKGSTNVLDGSSAKAAAEQYKGISPEEHESLNHTATENKQANELAYKKWVQSYTPTEIKAANNARDKLRREAKAAGKKTVYPHIQDDRLVKPPANSYALFVKDRFSSGDMKGMAIAEVGRLIAREWKGLSAAEKKSYEDSAKGDLNRYVEEVKSVYGIDVRPSKSGTKAATAA